MKCSADLLLGLTEELHGGGGLELKWKNPEEKPKIERIVVAKFKLPGADQTKTMLAKWDGDLWCFPSDAPIDSVCVGWWPVPEEEQENDWGEDECKLCKSAHPFCDKCCNTCDDKCNAGQMCRKEDKVKT